MIIASALNLAGCGSPRSTAPRDDALDEAIACYVNGDLERAEALLRGITSESRVDEDCVTAYLYLGRLYMARGDYERAADAFSAGEALGGDVRFAEYFEEAQSHLTTSPARIIQVVHINRGQLAGLIGESFGSRLQSVFPADADRSRPKEHEGTLTGETGEPAASSDLEDGIAVVTRSGVMDALPDGDFHAGDEVTRPAFYAVIWRLARVLGEGGDVLAELFPGGFRGTLVRQSDGVGRPAKTVEFVSGSEARRVIDALARAVGSGDE